ncbi:MAG: hypothetical protein ACRDZN_03645 [Acidimicrobiales bacterium]
MVRPAERGQGFLGKIGIALLVVLVAWLAVQLFLGFVFSLIRMALFVALFAVVAWFVLVGPPDRRE